MRWWVGGRGGCCVAAFGGVGGFEAVAVEAGEVEVRGRMSERQMERRWLCVGER